MAGLRLLGVLCAAVAVALVLDAAVCLLPENAYQRWQYPRDYPNGRARWIYERIHFDPTPIDVVILGPSRAQLGFGAAAVEERLAQHGKHVNVVNFAVEGSGRNMQSMIVDELFKTKSPKVIVLRGRRPALPRRPLRIQIYRARRGDRVPADAVPSRLYLRPRLSAGP